MTCWTTPGAEEALKLIGGGLGDKGGDAPAFEPVEGQPARRGVEHGLGFFGRLFLDHRIDPHVRIMGHILRFRRVAENARKMTPQRRHRRTVDTGEIPRRGRLLGHGNIL